MTTVSICVPTYNNVIDVKRLIQSISLQTFKDYEVIITDDSGDDEIKNYIDTLSSDKIKYFKNKIKLGHIHNWNEAILKASGKFVKIMFSDDWFTFPNSLELFVTMLEGSPEANFAFSTSMQVSENHAYERVVPDEYIQGLKKDYRKLFCSNQIGAPSDVIFRNDGTLFDSKSNWASDVFLYFSILSKNQKFVFCPKPLVSIGLHGEQYTHSFDEKDRRIFNDYNYLFKKYNLYDENECRDQFEKLMLRYFRTPFFAYKCNYGFLSYSVKLIKFIWKNKVADYLCAGIRKTFKRT